MPTSGQPQQAATVLYDAECQFCRWVMGTLLVWDRQRRLAPLALQDPAAESLLAGLTPEQRMETWHLIAPSGARFSGGAAFAPLLELLPAGAPLARLADRFPQAASVLYDGLARHRGALAKVVPRALHRSAARRLAERMRLLGDG